MLQNSFIIYTSYARTAIYLALMAIDVKNKEVMLPAFTCATTLPDAIVQAGGIPIFIDININNLQMIEDDILNKITKNSKVVISHHYYGAYCENISTINQIARSNNLIHIEDFAHSYGTKCSPNSDIAIYSFSKNMNNPGGGMAVFYNYDLFRKAELFQVANRNLFHNFVTNYETFIYLDSLIRDRDCDNLKINKRSIKTFLYRIAIKFLKLSKLYKKNFFYKITQNDVNKKFIKFDTRMTNKQKDYIFTNISDIGKVINKRIATAKKLNELLPTFLPFEKNVFTNYAIFSNEIDKLETIFKKLNIRTRRVWPYFQKYWDKQKTHSVEILKEKLLLVDLDCITDNKLLELKGLLYENQIFR